MVQTDLSVLAQSAYDTLSYLFTTELPVYQGEIWKELDYSSRTATRVGKQLSEAGLITRTEANHNQTNTYRWDFTSTGEKLQKQYNRANEYLQSEYDSTVGEVADKGGYNEGELIHTLTQLDAGVGKALLHIIIHDELSQAELWKALDISSRQGSRYAKLLAEKGYITREIGVYNGSQTYILTPTDVLSTSGSELEVWPESELTQNTVEKEEQSEEAEVEPVEAGEKQGTEVDDEGEEADDELEVVEKPTSESEVEKESRTQSDDNSEANEAEVRDAEDEPAEKLARDSPYPTGDDVTTEVVKKVIKERPGIPQSELWKVLGISSRSASRFISQLKAEGYVQREETVYDGVKTYALHPPKKELDFSLLMAGDMMSPAVGDEEHDSFGPEMDRFIFSLAEES